MPESCVAQPYCLFEHRVEHRREVAGRGIDDLQHLGGRGLLLQASRVSVRSRAFSIAITAWSAKVRTSSICRSVNGSTRWRARLMTPIGSPSRSSGTPSSVRIFAIVERLGKFVFRVGGDVR